MSASSASSACRVGSVVTICRGDCGLGGGREAGTGGVVVCGPRETVMVVWVGCLCRMIDGRFLSNAALEFDTAIGSAGIGGGGGSVEDKRFGEERELCNEGGTVDIVEDLKDPAMELTTEGLRLRLTGCETSGIACVCPFVCFRMDGDRSGTKMNDDPLIESDVESG